MQTIRALVDFVYLKVEKEREDRIGALGLVLDTRYEHGEHNRIWGTVVSVPKKLSDAPLLYLKEEIGFPYPRNPEFKFVTLADINPIVKEGDKVYFHFNTISEDNRLKEYFADIHSKIFKVRYDDIMCVVREGNIIMVGSWVLVDKVFDPDVKEVEVNGHMVMAKTTGSGLVTEIGVKPRPLAGTVVHIGDPFLCDEELEIVSGDQVLFTKESDWVNTIEGKEYYVMRQRDIIAKYEK